MIPLTLGEVAAAVRGRLVGVGDPGTQVTGTVEFDSRRVGPGGLFVALPGDRVDGHGFARAAVRAGAVAVLASRPVDVPAVLVPDPRDALALLATAVLDRLADLTVVGITGSSGKTSTKDLVAHLVERLGPTVAPPGSFNNEIGHPHTVLRADRGSRYLVLEKSARGLGHIAALCQIAPPRIGVVLNVGTAHLGEFGSRAAIASAKGELVEALPAADRGGIAVLNADDPLVAAMAGRTAARVVTTGVAEPADLRAVGVRLDRSGRASYTLVGRGAEARVRLGLHGGHHVSNSLAAAAVAVELGMSLPAVAAALGQARPRSPRRMEVRDRVDGLTVINDSYNANPESTGAALRALAAMAGGRRSWAVLGQMAELGPGSDAAHERIGRLAAGLGVDRLVAVGAEAGHLHRGFVAGGSGGEESVHVPDVESAITLVRQEVRPGDVVLVKASKVAALWRVADALLAGGPAREIG
ncbi:MAG TPA: UDP-N-acetylmuramoyl-tripeptide--D-alanyl-D-alanine ligase [Mycobacteriales bacterium]|nr:UDP-N-acetylmuramoyl-tripeptide--D-alanyl-D-alanine ligase [Mycobacteriales bacterium]